MRGRCLLCVTAVGLIVLGLLAGCDQAPSPTPFLPSPIRPSPRPTVSATVSPTPEPGPLPKVLIQVPLAPPDGSLVDLLLDRDSNRLYVTDSAGRLHVLDAATYAEQATLPAAGNLTLDVANHRLYASPEEDTGAVAAVDTNSLTVVGSVSPGGLVAVDTTHGRLYVGNRIYSAPAAGTPGVRVYDSGTLRKLGEVPQPGIPVYNPLRDELYIVAYTVYQADTRTLDVIGDLLPELTAQPLLWCNGCPAATNAHVFPDRNLLVVEMTVLSAGKGPGRMPQPRFFDATTLTELTDRIQPAVVHGCERQVVLVEPVDGRVYREESYSRYQLFHNLLVYDEAGNPVTWRDGLPLGIANPNTKQMYILYPLGICVLDLTTLSPLGRFPSLCFYTLDVKAGRIYAFQGRNLVVLSQSGGRPEPLPPLRVDALPAAAIRSIWPSPDYRRDQTLFLSQAAQLYRSTDGGRTWGQLRGGLPEIDNSWTMDLTVSPDFARDRTLFAYGYRDTAWGEGVYCSTDGGDTWQPMWNGLTHLRVYDVILSPNYATDGTLLAYARYQRIDSWQEGYSLSRSTDKGLHWTLALTQTEALSPPPPLSLLPSAPEPAVRFRKTDVDGKPAVARSADGGRTWETVFVLPPSAAYNTIQAVLPSPRFDADQTVYVLHRYGLCRSTDSGRTWQSWADARLRGRDYSNELTAAALSPTLDDERYQLFIGTSAGEFWSLDPTAMRWEPIP